jgi:hypothetical protein
VTHLQATRYAAKVLTLLFRDFLNATTTLKSKISKPNAKTVYLKSLALLQSHLPFFLRAVTFNANLDYPEEDFDLEFQGLIVQVLSLMSTLLSLYPKQSPKGSSLMLTMCLYSLKNPYLLER